jgi:hypothetical protein
MFDVYESLYDVVLASASMIIVFVMPKLTVHAIRLIKLAGGESANVSHQILEWALEHQNKQQMQVIGHDAKAEDSDSFVVP